MISRIVLFVEKTCRLFISNLNGIAYGCGFAVYNGDIRHILDVYEILMIDKYLNLLMLI